ncbi:hypothetical protein DFH07DRAFT_942006 [Mycena maculata]|uniref:Uncharacterized protein n=1 Tax=Mycena maculata TaxID=230809 RepID=A0AAD7IVW7_9AGAR|nr:hypothetical protein DFH07DRAFT_942006 [Mycena maculata]
MVGICTSGLDFLFLSFFCILLGPVFVGIQNLCSYLGGFKGKWKPSLRVYSEKNRRRRTKGKSKKKINPDQMYKSRPFGHNSSQISIRRMIITWREGAIENQHYARSKLQPTATHGSEDLGPELVNKYQEFDDETPRKATVKGLTGYERNRVPSPRAAMRASDGRHLPNLSESSVPGGSHLHTTFAPFRPTRQGPLIHHDT